MRLFSCSLLCLWVFLLSAAAGETAADPVLAEPPAPLAAALQKLMADEGHWAYTQTTQILDRDGRAKKGLKIERYDPSQPEDEQWTLLQWKGQPPGEREMRAWKRQKQKEMRRREEKSLGDIMDLNRAQAVRETGDAIVYEVPLMKGASRRLPAEKFVVRMTVSQDREALVNFELHARESFRLAGVARVDRVEIAAQFAMVDERYVPQPRVISASGSGKVLFFRVGGGAEIEWSDFRRVKPYKDRFVVELGELKVLEF